MPTLGWKRIAVSSGGIEVFEDTVEGVKVKLLIYLSIYISIYGDDSGQWPKKDKILDGNERQDFKGTIGSPRCAAEGDVEREIWESLLILRLGLD